MNQEASTDASGRNQNNSQNASSSEIENSKGLGSPLSIPLSNTIGNDPEKMPQNDPRTDRIRGWQDIQSAIKLTWKRQQKHLFTTWIHVPIGVAFLLVVCWALRLAIKQAPFRFPAPVIAMMFFFSLLLLLEYLSIKFPGKSLSNHDQEDKMEKGQSITTTKKQNKNKKRFVDPFMLLLAPPCEFCLRNMSVMFTPSFILIPAREIIPGKEIGLLTAWFIISQVLAFIFPIVMNRSIDYCCDLFKTKIKRNIRRINSNSNPSNTTASHMRDSRRGSMATLSGVDYEKGLSFSGGLKLGPIATGLSGLTAHVIAPVTHMDFDMNDDIRRQIESTVMEQARQQGVEEVIGHQRGRDPHQRRPLMYDSYKPVSDVSNYHHHFHAIRRPRSLSNLRRNSSRRKGEDGRSISPRPKTANAERSKSYDDGGLDEKKIVSLDAALKKITGKSSPTLDADEIQVIPTLKQRLSDSPKSSPKTDLASFKFPATSSPTFKDTNFNLPIPNGSSNQRNLDSDASELATAVPSRRESAGEQVSVSPKIEFKLEPHPSKGDGKALEKAIKPMDEDEEEEEETAVEQLASWFGDLITPTLYMITFIVGIPLFFVKDFALPLFLSINILTFIFAITIVPPKIRRFLHPILSTSLATVLIIWAFAALKGMGLKDCLNQYYSVNAKYSVLWDPKGYNGPVPGAGDILFSTLDAGIVALAVPMYRYRKELWENLTRILVILFPCAALSLFFWNYIARLMGMDPVRSMAFSARFMSTPLAIELAGNIGADESITVILVVITGVVAAILKEQFFYRLMKIKKEDYLTVGLTMGSTSGAIGASSLISTPRTMAIASLSFVIFGAILLVCTAIPPIVEIVQTLAGAN